MRNQTVALSPAEMKDFETQLTWTMEFMFNAIAHSPQTRDKFMFSFRRAVLADKAMVFKTTANYLRRTGAEYPTMDKHFEITISIPDGFNPHTLAEIFIQRILQNIIVFWTAKGEHYIKGLEIEPCRKEKYDTKEYRKGWKPIVAVIYT